MGIRQDVLDVAQASLAAWGYRHPQLLYDLYSARLIVWETAGRLVGRDHEESNTPFAGPLFTPRRA
jgi:hypothetical protein